MQREQEVEIASIPRHASVQDELRSERERHDRCMLRSHVSGLGSAPVPVSLPDELLLAALGFLDSPRDLLAAGLCWLAWARVAFDDSLWRWMLTLLFHAGVTPDGAARETVGPLSADRAARLRAVPLCGSFALTAAPVCVLIAVDYRRPSEAGLSRGYIELWMPRWVRLPHLYRWWHREFVDSRSAAACGRRRERDPLRGGAVPPLVFREEVYRARQRSRPAGSLYDCVEFSTEATMEARAHGPYDRHPYTCGWVDKVAVWMPDCAPVGTRFSPKETLWCKAQAAQRFRVFDLDRYF